MFAGIQKIKLTGSEERAFTRWLDFYTDEARLLYNPAFPSRIYQALTALLGIGGTMVILFGSIAVIGMKSISEIGWSDKNIMIVAISVCLGFGLTIATVTLGDGSLATSTSLFSRLDLGWLGDLLSNNVLNMFVLSIILSWALPDKMHINLFHKKEA